MDVLIGKLILRHRTVLRFSFQTGHIENSLATGHCILFGDMYHTSMSCLKRAVERNLLIDWRRGQNSGNRSTLIKGSTLCVDFCEVCFECSSPFRQFHNSDFTRRNDQTFQLITLLNHIHFPSPRPKKENCFLTWKCMRNIECISLFELHKFVINKRTGYPLDSEQFHEFEWRW
jgi:hypothetical protein